MTRQVLHDSSLSVRRRYRPGGRYDLKASRSGSTIRAFLGEGPVLTDDKPVIEYFLSLPKNDGPGGYTGAQGVFEEILTP